MSDGKVCRLCVEICEDYKSLYDESANASEVHQLMIQYFDQKQQFNGNQFNVMCKNCWQQISDFNSFQKSVYRAQRILSIEDGDIDIKSEEEFLQEDIHKQRIDFKREDSLSLCDSESMAVSSAVDGSVADENEEPVSDFTGGEFDNEVDSEAVNVERSDKRTGKIRGQVKHRKLYNKKVNTSDDLIAQWIPLLQCKLCSQKCSRFSLLKHHYQDKHPQVKCQVECCNKKYSYRDRLEDHVRLHIDSNCFACSFCGKNHTCRRMLAMHIRKSHRKSADAAMKPANESDSVSLPSEKFPEVVLESIPKYNESNQFSKTTYIKDTDDFIARLKPNLVCALCTEIYPTFSLLRQHFVTNHPEDKCYITCCQRKFYARIGILDHMRLHANPDIFKCKKCDKLYSSRSRLKLHLRRSHSESSDIAPKTKSLRKSDKLLAKWLPSTVCAVCKKQFPELAVLQRHFIERHTNEDFYIECCQRKFKNRREIVSHVQYHIDPTDLKCDECYLCFGCQKTIRTHLRLVH